jgi:predicted MFS family arabinose efflux permease
VLLVGALAGGLANAAVSGPSLAVAGTYFAGAEARRALGWATACMAGSAIVGVPVLTAVATLTGWRLAFIAAGGAVIGAVLLGAAWLPRDARVPEGRLRSETLLAAYRPLLRHRPTLRLYGVAVLRAICWFGLLTYFGAFLAEELALSTGRLASPTCSAVAGIFWEACSLVDPSASCRPARCWWQATSPWRC